MRNQFNLMFLQYSEKQTDKVGFAKPNTTTGYRKTDRQPVAIYLRKVGGLFYPRMSTTLLRLLASFELGYGKKRNFVNRAVDIKAKM